MAKQKAKPSFINEPTTYICMCASVQRRQIAVDAHFSILYFNDMWHDFVLNSFAFLLCLCVFWKRVPHFYCWTYECSIGCQIMLSTIFFSTYFSYFYNTESELIWRLRLNFFCGRLAHSRGRWNEIESLLTAVNSNSLFYITAWLNWYELHKTRHYTKIKHFHTKNTCADPHVYECAISMLHLKWLESFSACMFFFWSFFFVSSLFVWECFFCFILSVCSIHWLNASIAWAVKWKFLHSIELNRKRMAWKEVEPEKCLIICIFIEW